TSPAGAVRVLCTGSDELTWEFARPGAVFSSQKSSHHRMSIRARVSAFRKMFPVEESAIVYGRIMCDGFGSKVRALPWERMELPPGLTPWECLENNIVSMAELLRVQFSPLGRVMSELAPGAIEREMRRGIRLEERAKREAAERAR